MTDLAHLSSEAIAAHVARIRATARARRVERYAEQIAVYVAELNRRRNAAAIEVAAELGRDWTDCGTYERQTYYEEAARRALSRRAA